MKRIEFELLLAQAAEPQPIASPIGGRLLLAGWSVRETTSSAPATVTVLDGQDASGLEVLAAQLNPGGVARDWFGAPAIKLKVGFFSVITGAVKGAVYVIIDPVE